MGLGDFRVGEAFDDLHRGRGAHGPGERRT